MERTLTVLDIGTPVLVGGDIPGIITAISIRNEVAYEVAWWKERDRMICWLSDAEIMLTADPKKLTIGFRRNA